jgi:hypothetical protein
MSAAAELPNFHAVLKSSSYPEVTTFGSKPYQKIGDLNARFFSPFCVFPKNRWPAWKIFCSPPDFADWHHS